MAKRVATKKLLQQLNIEDELFCSFKLGIGIDPIYEKRSKKNSSTRYRYIVDWGNGWYYPPECWALSNAQIVRHLGYFELNSPRVPEFYGIRAQKRRPLTWVDFDIDNASHNFEDERLFKILETFGDDPCLVQYREESGNFSVIMRCSPLYPEKHKAMFTEILGLVGLEVKDGVVEIYPDVNRARRLPFGDQIVFLGGGYRRRPTDDEVPWVYQKLEVFDELREHYIINPFQVLRGLTGHRTYSKNVYTPKRKSSNNHNRTDERLGLNVYDRGKAKGDKSTGELSLNSPVIERILKTGLRKESTRYETEKRLIRWCYGMGKSEQEAYKLIEKWYNSGKTNGFSTDWLRSASKVLSALKGHVTSFYRWLTKCWAGSKVMETEPLTTEDVRKIIEVCDWDIKCAEWLYDCLKWTKARRQYQKHLYLSAKIMRKFKRGRDADKKWVTFLVEKGILTCADGDFFVGSRCRIWQVNFKFSQVGKIVPDSLSFKEALALVTTVDEIKQHYPKVTAWRLNNLRKKLAGLVLEEASVNESSGTGFEVALKEYAGGMRIEPSSQRKAGNIDGVQLVFEWYPRRE